MEPADPRGQLARALIGLLAGEVSAAGGSGTELRLIVNLPQGGDEGTDPPSVTVTPIGEDGGTLASTDVFTDDGVLKLSASDFTGLDFGTLLLDISNSGGGYAFANYSAHGLFSVGVNSACRVP